MGHALLADPLVGLVVVACCTLTLVATFGCLLYAEEIGRFVVRIADRVRPKPETAVVPPIETVAHNARRLRAELLALSPGTPMARRRGIVLAYEDVLALACQALDIPHALTGPGEGIDRDTERDRVEHELEEAGLRLHA